MAFEFKLNGQSVPEPKGWSNAALQVKRNDQLPGVFLDFILNVEFYDAGYSLLKAIYDGGTGCASVIVDITQDSRES